MKKRIISIFLAVLMVVSLLPTAAFSETGLTVTKANGDPATVDGAWGDYYYAGDNTLVICKDNLVVSGNASSTRIYVDDHVSNLKLIGVNITGPYLNDVFEIRNSDAFELILDGDNTLATNTSNYGILSNEGTVTISGNGTLSVTADSYAISTRGGLSVTSDRCKIVARGGYAAINNNLSGSSCIKTLADGLSVTASKNKDALEADITETAVYSGDVITVGNNNAKAALITKPAPVGHTHNITYSANGATLTATCTSGCDLDLDKNPESLTLTEELIALDEFTVDGLTGWPFGESGPLSEIVPEINYYSTDDLSTPLPGKPTEPGSYKVAVTFGDATVELEFTVSAPHTHGTGADAINFNKAISTFADLQDLFDNGGSGYLAADIVCTDDLDVNQDVSLCLNGKMLDLNGKGNITVSGFTTCNLYDCGNTLRNWDVDATGLWVPAAPSSTVPNTTIGGVITGGSADEGGCIAVAGTFNMYGGNIVANTADSGGGIYIIIGIGNVIMNSGNIVGNTATNGGGVWMDDDDRLIMLGGSITGNTATEQGGGIYYEGKACLAKGTMITLADGTRKPVEELDTGDDIRVFDHDSGSVSHAKISDYWHYGEAKSDAFTLHFSSGIDVTAVTAHSFYEKDENRYVSLNMQNAESYIGHFFYNADANRWETLERVTILDEPVETYLVATEKHLNCITEGMLSCEDDIYTVFRNVFAFDKNMQVDEEQKIADIATAGGLWSYEDCTLFTKESFDALNLQYAKVAVNKGMIRFEDIDQTAVYCSILDTGHFESSNAKTPLTLTARPMLMTAPEEGSSIEDFTGLTFGGNAQVKDNFLKNEDAKTANNIYLTSETVINLATGIYAPESEMLLCVSIEADSDRVPITGTANTDDVKYFKSDDPAYSPVYDTENTLINLEKAPVHTHIFAQDWSYNETAHWHACTAEGCDIEDYAACGIADAAYGTHNFANGECVCGLKKITVPELADGLKIIYIKVDGVEVLNPAVGDYLAKTNFEIKYAPVNTYKFKSDSETGILTMTATGTITAPEVVKKGIPADFQNTVWIAKYNGTSKLIITIGEDSATFNYDGVSCTIPFDSENGNAMYFMSESSDEYAQIDYKNSDIICIDSMLTNYESIFSDEVTKATLIAAPAAVEGLIYNGEEQTGVAAGTGYTLEGNKATDAGNYTSTATLADGYIWSDGTIEPKQIAWSIVKAALTATASSHTVAYGSVAPSYTATYTGWLNGEETPTTAAVLTSTYTTASDIGEYDVTFETEPVFANYNVTTENGKVTVERAKTAVEPTVAADLVYTGNTQNGYTFAGTNVTISDVSSATLVGSYQFKAAPDKNHAWSDGTIEAKTYDWSIAKAPTTITTPPTASAITYGQTLASSSLTGGEASVEGTFAWTDTTIAPTVADSNTTEYEVTFTPKDGDNYAATNCKITLTVNKRSSSGSSGGGANRYPVEPAPETNNGVFSVDKENAPVDSTVTITALPDKGFALAAITVADKNGKEIEVKSLGNNKYSFKMPSSKATISATFSKIDTCLQDEACVYAKFTDTDTKAWYHGGVHFCVENGYMHGVSKTEFNPAGSTTRAMIVTMLWRLEGDPVVNYAMSFKDVNADQWYAEAIRWAQAADVVEGYSADAFGPEDPVTREQMAAILYRFAKNHNIDVANTNTLAGFTDAEKVSPWARNAMKWANAVGLLQGRTTTTLVPDASITRAEAATMMQRYCEKLREN